MSADVDIVNAALVKLGEQTIASLSEDVKPARLASFIYADVRDAVLRAHPWNFALKRALLAASTAAPTWGYVYAYNLPADPDYCLRALTVNGENQYSGKWKVEGRQILTDLGAPLKLLYISRATVVDDWDALFREALSARLAAELAEPLGKATSLQEAMVRLYGDKLGEARSSDGQEGVPDLIEADLWTDARL